MKRGLFSALTAALLALSACAGAPTEAPATEAPETGAAESEAAREPLETVEARSVLEVPSADKLLYKNDLDLNGCADPSVLAVAEGKRTCFYLYCTGIKGYYSYDLSSWIEIPNVFPKPGGTWAKENYWAPEILRDEEAGVYRLFYSARGQDGFYYISMATADSPKGPFVPWTGTNADGLAITPETPIYDFSRMDPAHPLYEGVIRSIDVFPFVDPATGEKYLYWVHAWGEGGTVRHETSEVWGMRMKDWETPDYATVTRLTEVAKATVGGAKTRHGETSINEGPAVQYRDGTYYLTFSINPASYKGYSVWQALGEGPLGPFTKLEKNEGGMVLGVDSDWTHASGTGHHCFFRVGDELWIAYHAHTRREYTTMGDRAFAFDRVVWIKNDAGQTVLHANGPTWSPQPLPETVSGYRNAAPEAALTVTGLAGGEAAALTDGAIRMHSYEPIRDASFTDGAEITLTWETPIRARAILLYNSPLLSAAFAGARVEMTVLDRDGAWVTREIRAGDFPQEAYVGENAFGVAGIRPGAALVWKLIDVTTVREMRVFLSVPEGQGAAEVTELVVLGKDS